MKNRAIIPVLLVIAILATALAVLTGCAPEGDDAADAAAANRSYMSQANNIAMQLDEDLGPFTEAVADADLVSMEQAAANVYRDIETFKALEAPEAMKDIHAEYSAGCDDLKDALQSYIALYQGAEDADADTLDAGIAEVQAKYDSGIAHLQAADQMVTALPGAVPSSSSSAQAGSASTAAAASSSSGN